MNKSLVNPEIRLSISELSAILSSHNILNNYEKQRVKGGDGDTGEDAIMIPPPPPHR